MLNVRLNRAPLTALTRYAVVFALGAVTVAVSSAALSATAPIVSTDVALAERPQERAVVREPVVTPAPARPRPVRTTRVVPAVPGAPGAASLDAARGRQAPATLTGVLRDPSGAVLPGVQLTLRDATEARSAVTDGAGRYAFRDLGPGRHTLTAVLPGFATATSEFEVPAGAAVERNLELRIGSLQETITVTCATGAAAIGRDIAGVMASAARVRTDARSLVFGTREAPALAQAPPGTPVRVGGQIRAPRQIRNIHPTCPGPPASDTVVILEATIGTDGLVKDVRNLRTSVPPELADAAAEAVRQWQYTPTLLNNVAVPVIMTVTVQFRVSQ